MPDAFEMIREDHRKVQELFKQFESTEDMAEKKRLVQNALTELKVHAAVEEEILYPAIREEIDDDEKVDQALEEHHVAKVLIAELERMNPRDERYDAKFTVLAESVKHHIEEEESEVLPKVESSLDGENLGTQIEERKPKLMRRFADGASAGGPSRARTRARGRQTATKRGRKTTRKRPAR